MPRMVRFRAMLARMDTDTARIASKVRGAAAEHRFSQQQIADALNISRKSVVERFNGRVAFTATEVFRLAGVMRVPVSRFFPDSSEMPAGERAA